MAKAKETSSWGSLHNYWNNISPPSNADDNEMLTYLSTTLTTIESQYPGCGILPAGDFNRLNVSRLLTITLSCCTQRSDLVKKVHAEK